MLGSQLLRLPESAGLIFNSHFGKTAEIRRGSGRFGGQNVWRPVLPAESPNISPPLCKSGGT